MPPRNDDKKVVRVIATNVHRAMLNAERLFPAWEAVSAEPTYEYRVVIKKRRK